MKKFNDNFLIGAATAAHQVEGNNKNSDFWVLENVPYSIYKEPSLDADDHYNRYEEDIKLLADAGLNAYRFSIEWARIEPEEGKFDDSEVEHYKKVLECCHKNNVTPVVTLHHFSSPKWLISLGGWENEKTVEYFGRYVEYVVSRLGSLSPYICTINEANMGIQVARIMKEFMGKRGQAAGAERKTTGSDAQVGLNISAGNSMQQYYMNAGKAFGVDPRHVNTFVSPRTEEGDMLIMKCHQKAKEVIKEINPDIKVGITMSLYDYQALEGGEENFKKLWNEDFLHYLPYIKEDDFFGVQNYTRKLLGADGKVDPAEGSKMTEAGNEYYPKSLAGVLRFVSKHLSCPLMVTENGISTSNDKDRVEFINAALSGVYDCINEGINVIGYMHWSLMDNFEWQLGYAQKFGLISVDRKTQKRKPKESLSVLGSIRKNGLK